MCVRIESREGWARPKVSLVLDDGGVVSVVLTCVRVQPPWLPWHGCWALEPLGQRSAAVVAALWGAIDGDSALDVVHGDRVRAW
jgi:hypothetical protein